jgi:hypothetical protein
VVRNVPSHGANSTKTSVTRMRPGSCSAAGQGVDIKHGSYARYLARIKGRGPYRTPRPCPRWKATKPRSTAYQTVTAKTTAFAPFHRAPNLRHLFSAVMV